MTGQMHEKNLAEQASYLERVFIRFLASKILVKRIMNMLKSSGAELKLMTDINEYLMVEKGIHEGMIMASYHAMIQYMLTEILRKVSLEQVLDIQSIASDTKIGYILKVDLKVSIYLHDFFVDYSLALEKQIVPKEWLSLHNKRLVYNKEVEVENI
ncbi:314_t:CDS:2 [Funneliformis mosseae]|uniref:314_t:CDS:1 n=1 Tax=Funneliformis mosseae TaxID=27381 RepID=A0A9N9G1E6_FUNMO|nr:314_t:CDS:2 [Funneliformis mosseae]